MFQKISKKDLCYTIFVFLCLCILFLIIPYTDDDLRWGTTNGIYRLKHFFFDYGGRYLGYMIVLVLTRFPVLKAVFMAVTIILLARLILIASGYEFADRYVLFFLFLMPIPMFQQTLGWVSGFSNYVTSITTTFCFIAIAATDFRNETITDSLIGAILLFLLGMANTLIVEHFTIYNILLGIAVVITLYRKHRRFFLRYIGYILGCISGAAWMFSNSTYRNVTSGSDNYRQINLHDLLQNIKGALKLICRMGYYRYGFLHLTLAVLFGIFIYSRKQEMSVLLRRIILSLYWINIVLVVCLFVIEKLVNLELMSEIPVILLNLMCVSSLAIVIVLTILLSRYHKAFWNVLFLLISILIVDAPFFIVRPITTRVFYGSYVFFIAMVPVLLPAMPPRVMEFFRKKAVKWVFLLGFLMIWGHHTCIYYEINRQDQARLADIRRQVEEGATTVELYRLPEQKYTHDINPKYKQEVAGYKNFYHLPAKLELIPLDEYKTY